MIDLLGIDVCTCFFVILSRFSFFLMIMPLLRLAHSCE